LQGCTLLDGRCFAVGSSGSSHTRLPRAVRARRRPGRAGYSFFALTDFAFFVSRRDRGLGRGKAGRCPGIDLKRVFHLWIELVPANEGYRTRTQVSVAGPRPVSVRQQYSGLAVHGAGAGRRRG